MLLARPTDVAARFPQLIFGIGEGLLIGFHLLLRRFDLGGFFVNVAARQILFQGFVGVVVILHVQHPQLALAEVDVVLVLRQSLIQFRKKLAPAFFIIGPWRPCRCCATSARSSWRAARISRRFIRGRSNRRYSTFIGNSVVVEHPCRGLRLIFLLLASFARHRRKRFAGIARGDLRGRYRRRGRLGLRGLILRLRIFDLVLVHGRLLRLIRLLRPNAAWHA